jgi:bla regulator protein BlaR1
MIGHAMIGQWTNHLWQSTLFAVVAALATLAFRKNRAHVRYSLWLSASVKFLVPFALLMNLGNNLWSAFAARKIATELALPAVSLTVQQITQPFTDGFSFVPSAPHTHTANWIPIAILGVWICGFLGVALARFRGWLRIRAAMRASTPNDIQVAVAVRSSPGLLEPGVVGVLRPVLLLPEGILKRLSPPQLEAVIAHELSHIKRRDNLTAAIHMIVEAVFWFHPLVWWIGARLVEERERACDEAVLRLGGEPRDYADAIVIVCKLYVESPLTCVSGISGADLKKRIVRIMACHVGLNMSLGRKLLLGVAGWLTLAVPVVVGWGQVQAGVVTLIHPKDGVRHAFEVATIKPRPDTAQGMRIMTSPGGYSATDMSVNDMINYAYGIKSDDQLVGAPGWLKTEHFDIQAKLSDADVAAFYKLGSEDRRNVPRLLMQSLLEDRFQLKAKLEVRDLLAYALVVDKGGIKMKEVTPEPDPLTPPGVVPDARSRSFGPTGPNEFTASNWQMPNFAVSLSHFYEVGNRPVVDETGLKGSYDFVLNGVSMRAPPAGDANASGTLAPELSLFTALPEQLGLKLVPVKAPVETLVIDHIEQPSPN